MVKRVIKISLAVLLLIVLCGAIFCAVLTNGFRDWNPYCLDRLGGHKYGNDGICVRCGAAKLDDVDNSEQKHPSEDEILRSGVSAQVSEERGIKLETARLAQYDSLNEVYVHNSYILTATILPANAVNQEVDWSIRWKNAESEFATDKEVTEYCTISPESDGALKATLTNLRDFGEQIEVVVTSRDNPSAQAICLVDYVQKVKSVSISISDKLKVTTVCTTEIEYTDYTIPAELKVDATVVFSSGFAQSLDRNPYTPVSYNLWKGTASNMSRQVKDIVLNETTFNLVLPSYGYDYSKGPRVAAYLVDVDPRELDSSSDDGDFGGLEDWFFQLAYSYKGNHVDVTFNCYTYYNGVRYGETLTKVECQLDVPNWYGVSDVVPDDDHVFF